MTEANLDDIAYQLKRNKDNNQHGAIVFLGAGASVTAGIPQAGKIAEEILERFKEAPAIIRLKQEDQKYSLLMGCITPHDRKELLNGYIDSAKINVAHIYLAHLMHQGYIDYIVTVNFDNLTLRALSLFNEFPATYDISILKEITTTTLDNPAVIFMHGQHHGLWQLNTTDEMAKIKATAPHIFRQIADRRPWIVVGYGATDPVFDHLVDLGRFDNQLFWVSYKYNEPATHVKENLLDNSNSGAYWVKGYDADSFFLKLNTELTLPQPDIFSKPFSHLKKLQASVVDVQQDMELKDVHERMTITGRWIQDAIEKYEHSDANAISKIEIEADKLRLELINSIVESNFEKIAELEEKINAISDPNAYTDLLSGFYNNWGIALSDLAKIKSGAEAEELYQQASSKYQRATELKPDYYNAFNNWGVAFFNLAKIKKGEEAVKLYQHALSKYQRATEIKPNYKNAFTNWGTALLTFAQTKTGVEQVKLLTEAKNKAEEAYQIGCSSYNLACANALLNNTHSALQYLEEAVSKGDITVEHVTADTDWDDFIDKQAFITLLDKYKK